MRRLTYSLVCLMLILYGCQGTPKKTPITPTPISPTTEFFDPIEHDLQEFVQKEDITEPPEIQISKIDNLEDLYIIHQVQPGDTVSDIASKYLIGQGLVIKINELKNPNLIHIGQKLKVIQGPFRILVQKNTKTLDIFLGDKLYKTYDITIGKNNSTPEGQFEIRDKMIKPVWTDPYNRNLVYPNDPNYPLGTRWIEFAENGYGIHGTNDPSSIKQEASFGCVRMLNQDVEDVYDMVIIGSAVEILS